MFETDLARLRSGYGKILDLYWYLYKIMIFISIVFKHKICDIFVVHQFQQKLFVLINALKISV